MSFDGIRKTEEPKVPDGMIALRLLVGYNKYGTPIAALCNKDWGITNLRECDREHYNDDSDEEPDNSDLIPVSHVQRIMLFVPAVPPDAKVAKVMDLSALMAVKSEPVSIEMVAPDADSSKIVSLSRDTTDKAKRDEALWGIPSR